MKQKMIVSNIRIPESDWLQVKAAASDLGISVNRYINYAIEKFTIARELSNEPRSEKKTQFSIWNLPKISNSIKMKPMGLSKEDEEIYGI